MAILEQTQTEASIKMGKFLLITILATLITTNVQLNGFRSQWQSDLLSARLRFLPPAPADFWCALDAADPKLDSSLSRTVPTLWYPLSARREMPECFEVRGVESCPLSYASGVDRGSSGRVGRFWGGSRVDDGPFSCPSSSSLWQWSSSASGFSRIFGRFGSDAPSGWRREAYCSMPAIATIPVRLGNELWLGVRDIVMDWRQSRQRGLGGR
uniref:Uncharacterized protein n=1 Tax=Anopheles coluzzii TaxID=1518534 RepID=A0A8W7PDX1_ANOCL